jgi:hypothetical protein
VEEAGMKTQATLKEVVGKAMTGYVWETSYNREVLLLFGDEMVYLRLKYDYDDEEISECGEPDPLGFDEREMIEKGVISAEEIERLKAERDAEYQRQLESIERAAHERLRAKYEREFGQ